MSYLEHMAIARAQHALTVAATAAQLKELARRCAEVLGSDS